MPKPSRDVDGCSPHVHAWVHACIACTHTYSQSRQHRHTHTCTHARMHTHMATHSQPPRAFDGACKPKPVTCWGQVRKALRGLTPNSWEGAVLLCAASCFYFSEVCCTCVSRQGVHVAGTRTRTQAFQACLHIEMYMQLWRTSDAPGSSFPGVSVCLALGRDGHRLGAHCASLCLHLARHCCR